MIKYIETKFGKLGLYVVTETSTLLLAISIPILIIVGLISGHSYYYYLAAGCITGYMVLKIKTHKLRTRLDELTQKLEAREIQRKHKSIEKERNQRVTYSWSPLYLKTNIILLLLIFLAPIYLPEAQGDDPFETAYYILLNVSHYMGIMLLVLFSVFFTLTKPNAKTPNWMKVIKPKSDANVT